MSSHMLVRHKVRDFPFWKRGYDAHLPKRIEAGLTEEHLFRNSRERVAHRELRVGPGAFLMGIVATPKLIGKADAVS